MSRKLITLEQIFTSQNQEYTKLVDAWPHCPDWPALKFDGMIDTSIFVKDGLGILWQGGFSSFILAQNYHCMIRANDRWTAYTQNARPEM
jgi:hypothetical protein